MHPTPSMIANYQDRFARERTDGIHLESSAPLTAWGHDVIVAVVIGGLVCLAFSGNFMLEIADGVLRAVGVSP